MRSLTILVTYTIYCIEHISSESTTEPTPSTSRDNCEAQSSFLNQKQSQLDELKAEFDKFFQCTTSNGAVTCETLRLSDENRLDTSEGASNAVTQDESFTLPSALYPEEQEIFARTIRWQEEMEAIRRSWAENPEDWRRRFQEPRGEPGPVVAPLLPVPESETQEQMISRLKQDAENIYLQWRDAQERLLIVRMIGRRTPCSRVHPGAREMNGRYFRSQPELDYTPDNENYCNIARVLRGELEATLSAIPQHISFPRNLYAYMEWRSYQ